MRERVADESWRRASQAIGVSAGLPDARAVPLLVDALDTWIARSAEGQTHLGRNLTLTR